MSKLSEVKDRETKKVNFVSSPDDYIEIYTDLLFGDVREIDKLQKGDKGNEIDIGIKMIILIAKGWSITDDNGETLPINKENLSQLPSKDINEITKAVTGIVNPDNKKK